MVGWKYAKKILDDWVKGDINSIEKIQAEDLKFKNKNNKQNKQETKKEERQYTSDELNSLYANQISKGGNK